MLRELLKNLFRLCQIAKSGKFFEQFLSLCLDLAIQASDN